MLIDKGVVAVVFMVCVVLMWFTAQQLLVNYEAGFVGRAALMAACFAVQATVAGFQVVLLMRR